MLRARSRMWEGHKLIKDAPHVAHGYKHKRPVEYPYQINQLTKHVSWGPIHAGAIPATRSHMVVG